MLSDTIAYSTTPAPRSDNAGPAVTLLRNGSRLEGGATVPAEFELEGVVSDSSGIMIAPVAGEVPLFYVNNPTGATNLTDLLVFFVNGVLVTWLSRQK